MGARPAIQSQWTYRPNSGLIAALSATNTPTTAAANPTDTVQLRFALTVLLFILWPLFLLRALLALTGLFIGANYRIS